MADKKTVIHWFRRDLRLQDNTALHEAASQDDVSILPVFIFDDTLLASKRVGANRLQFMLDALASLAASIDEAGGTLYFFRGKPADVLKHIVAAVGADELYFNRDYSPYARSRDEQVGTALSIPLHSFHDVVLVPPGGVLKGDGDPYKVYSPFYKVWAEVSKHPISHIDASSIDWYQSDEMGSIGLPTRAELGHDSDVVPLPEASETAAHASLDRFIDETIRQYNHTRNNLPKEPFEQAPDDATSFLSPYLRMGILSPRRCYWAARDTYAASRSDDYRRSIKTWVKELAWRDFYIHIMYFFPHVLQRDFDATYETLDWQQDEAGLQAWKDGMTGYPVVDAPMRQMKQIGWMPNRARMIVASFLCKDLLINWKPGDYYFMQNLIDGDPAANNGGWQWAAGTGTDAQPYFRIFNPTSQSEKFATPDYLRYWIPELRDVADEDIHQPHQAANPPEDYPAPIVNHKEARERTIAAFKAARDSS